MSLIVPLRTTARAQWRLNWSKGHVTDRRIAGVKATAAALTATHGAAPAW